MTLHKMKELDHNNASGPATLDVADDDIEEGEGNRSKTRLIAFKQTANDSWHPKLMKEVLTTSHRTFTQPERYAQTNPQVNWKPRLP